MATVTISDGTPSSASAIPSPTSTGGLLGFSSASASTLVIVVPLATSIFFGLGICYVARSMRIRRRTRRLQEAIADGSLPEQRDGGAFASSQVKPRMWDVSLINKGGYDKQSLEGMLPLAAAVVPEVVIPARIPSFEDLMEPTVWQHLMRVLGKSTKNPSLPDPPIPPSASDKPDLIQIVVFIAMPSSTRETGVNSREQEKERGGALDAGGEEEDVLLGEVVFGVTELSWSGGGDNPTKSTESGS